MNIDLVVVVIVLVVLGVCVSFIWLGATAFSVRGLRWSRDGYLQGTAAKIVGVPLIALGIGGVANLIQRGIEADIFTPKPTPPLRMYRSVNSPPVHPTAPRATSAARPAQIPAGAHVDPVLGFYIVPPGNYAPEPGMIFPLVARFKEKLEGEEIEHRVAVSCESKPAGMTLASHFESELEGIKAEEGNVILESGDATIGGRPCKYVIYKPRFVLTHMIYFYMDEQNVWLILSTSARTRFDEDARKLLAQSIESFRTFEMANEEAKQVK